MNVDELCNANTAKDSLDRVMRHWQHTRSPFVYWTRKMVNMAATEREGNLNYKYSNYTLRLMFSW